MTSLFFDPSSCSVSREVFWRHIRVQTRAASGALAGAFETVESKGISKKTFPRTYLADTERHQEPAAHRCRRQKPPHRDGHFAGWPAPARYWLRRTCRTRRRTRRRSVYHVTFSSFFEKSLIVHTPGYRDAIVNALARWPRGRSPLACTLLLTRWYRDKVSEKIRESRHGRDEEDRWRVSDWRNNDCARRAASRDAQMFSFLVGMELAVVAIPSSFDSLCIRNAGIHVSGFGLFAG